MYSVNGRITDVDWVFLGIRVNRGNVVTINGELPEYDIKIKAKFAGAVR